MICDGAKSVIKPEQPAPCTDDVALGDSTNPAGKVSINDAPVMAAAESLVSVKVSDVISPSTILLAPNSLVNLGAGNTSKHCGATWFCKLIKPAMEFASFVKFGAFTLPH